MRITRMVTTTVIMTARVAVMMMLMGTTGFQLFTGLRFCRQPDPGSTPKAGSM